MVSRWPGVFSVINSMVLHIGKRQTLLHTWFCKFFLMSNYWNLFWYFGILALKWRHSDIRTHDGNQEVSGQSSFQNFTHCLWWEIWNKPMRQGLSWLVYCPYKNNTCTSKDINSEQSNEATCRWCEPTCLSHEPDLNLLLHLPDALCSQVLIILVTVSDC